MTLGVWLTERLREYYVDPQGYFWIDLATDNEALPLDPTIRSVSYRRFTLLGKPKQVTFDTNNFPIMSTQRKEVSVPVKDIGAYMQMTKHEYNGDSSQFLLDWVQIFDLAEQKFLLQFQDDAEIGYYVEDTYVEGLLTAEDLLKFPTPIFKNAEGEDIPLGDFQLNTQEDANIFRRFLQSLVLKVNQISKRTYKADSIVLPYALEELFTTPMPFYAGADEDGMTYLKNRGIEVFFSINANTIEGGRILVYRKEFAKTKTTYALRADLDMRKNEGNQVLILMEMGFAGVYFAQPLSAVYLDNSLVLPSAGKSVSSKTSNKTKKEEVGA